MIGFLLNQGEQRIFIRIEAIESITKSDDDGDGNPVIIRMKSGIEHYFYDVDFDSMLNGAQLLSVEKIGNPKKGGKHGGSI